MPEKRNYYMLVSYIVPLGSMTPDELRSDTYTAMTPEGCLATTDILEDVDMVSQDDWERVGSSQMLSFERAVRRNGWPRTRPPPEAVVVPIIEPPDDEHIEETAEGECWNCGSRMVTTGHRGAICPQGCGDRPGVLPTEETPEPDPGDPPAIGADDPLPEKLPTGAGTPMAPYEPTRESRPPTSYPQGEIETTD